MLKRRIIRIIRRLKRCSYTCILCLCKCIFMIIADIIQTLCNIGIFITDNSGVEIYRIRTISVQPNLQNSFFIQYLISTQIQTEVLSCLFDFLRFQFACPVQCIDFIAGTCKFIAICFYVYIQTLIGYRSDGIMHRRYIHPLRIACKCIDLIISI